MELFEDFKSTYKNPDSTKVLWITLYDCSQVSVINDSNAGLSICFYYFVLNILQITVSKYYFFECIIVVIPPGIYAIKYCCQKNPP